MTLRGYRTHDPYNIYMVLNLFIWKWFELGFYYEGDAEKVSAWTISQNMPNFFFIFEGIDNFLVLPHIFISCFFLLDILIAPSYKLIILTDTTIKNKTLIIGKLFE